MDSRSFDLDPVDNLAVTTVGQPGQRQFFLQGRGAGQTVTLAIEKIQVQNLLARIVEQLQGQGIEPGGAPSEEAIQPLEAAWRVGELGLGFHESRRMFVLVAREVARGNPTDAAEGAVEGGPSPAETEPEGATARFWATPEQVRAFSQQAEKVLAGGRAVCQYCGLPMDPNGHPCPAANGSRPIF